MWRRQIELCLITELGGQADARFNLGTYRSTRCRRLCLIQFKTLFLSASELTDTGLLNAKIVACIYSLKNLVSDDVSKMGDVHPMLHCAIIPQIPRSTGRGPTLAGWPVSRLLSEARRADMLLGSAARLLTPIDIFIAARAKKSPSGSTGENSLRRKSKRS